MSLSILLLCGCAGMTPHPGGPEEQGEAHPAPPGGVWLLYVKDEPVAEVEVVEPSWDDRVDVQYRGRTAEVRLQHQGVVRLTPITHRLAGGVPVVFRDDARGGGPSLPQPLNEDVPQDWLGKMQQAVAWMSPQARVTLVQSLGEPALLRLSHSPGGLLLLEHLFAPMVSSGHPGNEEARQSRRILEAVARLSSPLSFVQAVMDSDTVVFPYRASGATVLHSTPLSAFVRSDGKIEVNASIRSYHPDNVEGEKPIPDTHLVLDPQKVVAIKLYDEGGKMVFAPALFLVDLASSDALHTKLKLLEMAGLGVGAGLSLGAGALMDAGVEARLIPHVLAWCDEAALGLGGVTLVLDEQRGWILSTFDEKGRRFLRWVDGLNSAVALYGMARVVMAAPRLVLGVRSTFRDFLSRASALEPQEAGELQRLRTAMERFTGEVDAIQACRGGGELCGEGLAQEGAQVIPLDSARRPGATPEAPSQPLPLEEEEALAATGTDTRLVPIRHQAAQGTESPVASFQRGPGKDTTPRGSAPPVTRTSTPSRSVSRSTFNKMSASPIRAELRTATKNWAQQFETQPAQGTGAQRAFQVRYCGPTETHVVGGGAEVWADGIIPEEGFLQDAKLTETPDRSPFVDMEPHPIPELVREQILDKINDELARYAKVINAPATPVVGLEIVTNAKESVPFWTRMLREHGIPGRVVVKPWP